MIYFDYNASAPMLPEARRAWVAATESLIGNPSSPHRLGGRADAALAGARESLARLLECAPPDLVFTSGATEGANTIFHHSALAQPGKEAWISAVEHPAVIAAAESRFGEKLRRIPVDAHGVVELGWMEEHLKRAQPAIIAVMSANNETGVLQPWREVLSLVHRYEVPFFCDATQTIGKLAAAGLGECDFATGSAHKFGGPRGVGFLKCPARGRLHALLRGGPQEEGRRAGTENVPGVLSMLAALEKREEQIRAGEHQSAQAWRNAFEKHLLETLPDSSILGGKSPRLWNTSAVVMPESDCRQRWVVKLDKLGFAVSTGSACASGQEEPSHVLQAMGVPGRAAGRALRFSGGWETTREQWEALLNAVRKVHQATRPRQEIEV